jgi:hypothetical protein
MGSARLRSEEKPHASAAKRMASARRSAWVTTVTANNCNPRQRLCSLRFLLATDLIAGLFTLLARLLPKALKLAL